MRRIGSLLVAAFLLAACGCTHTEIVANQCGGTTACAKAACDPVDIVSEKPNRPFRPLGIVQVRVDRGTGMTHPKLEDAIPKLQEAARAIGGDAVILTHEEFLSWYDNGEDKSPIHDLEQQESWYITEKGRYISGLAVAYTGQCAPPPPPCQPLPCPPSAPVTPGPQQGTGWTTAPPSGGAPAAPAMPESPPGAEPATSPPPPPPPPATTTPPPPPPPPPGAPLPPPRRLS